MDNLQNKIAEDGTIHTDIVIVGAGPCGLFTVFEAGLLKMHCHLVDALGAPGGQLSEIYPKKPIYDIPGYPEILAQDLVDNLMKQIEPFQPGFTFGERAEKLEKTDAGFVLTTNRGTVIHAKVAVIAGGLGCFEPRKPNLPGLESYEDRGVDYIIKDPEKFRDKRVVIAGGGDSALDWSIYLANVAKEVTLVHRRTEFRGALESVDKVHQLAAAGKIRLVKQAQITTLQGEDHLSEVTLVSEAGEEQLKVDYFIPLFGLSPELGPIADWGLNISRNAIEVNTMDYSTNVPGIYAVGDINTYPGKLKLILCGFHEAAIMCQFAFNHVYPDKKPSFKYTTVVGVTGF